MWCRVKCSTNYHREVRFTQSMENTQSLIFLTCIAFEEYEKAFDRVQKIFYLTLCQSRDVAKIEYLSKVYITIRAWTKVNSEMTQDIWSGP